MTSLPDHLQQFFFPIFLAFPRFLSSPSSPRLYLWLHQPSHRCEWACCHGRVSRMKHTKELRPLTMSRRRSRRHVCLTSGGCSFLHAEPGSRLLPRDIARLPQSAALPPSPWHAPLSVIALSPNTSRQSARTENIMHITCPAEKLHNAGRGPRDSVNHISGREKCQREADAHHQRIQIA